MTQGSALPRAAIIDLVEHQYFGSVARNDIAAVRACFTDNAVVTIRHGDNPTRTFKSRPAPGEAKLTDFWEHLCANFDAAFNDFEHVIDLERACCAATFTVTLAPKSGSAYFQRGTLTLRNCNFFWLESGRIARMIVYYANPDTGGPAAGKPTGYAAGSAHTGG